MKTDLDPLKAQELFLFFAITPIPGRVGRGIPKYYTE
uniref:Uncharacterized protein n=1 Tax=Setaria viridis TaxID=4556 RepID=A0A4U6TN23_SETVI|nr:hypothetical protein SEVIR_8G240600v2 [Setaria viridis]